ncbi:hypothetical protein [Ralstonia pseudosolanacearum]|uniref:hypothetical protein n=1 Tax=Ralstonia pseudosolanacearum TaxID=1310165 RepID=UPI0008F855D6|nr:hypothetical protein [Ralstonia pseudosolanacearum]API73564.1 hypothetical protein AC251_02745 [Ralstonia pseudosolanacearum]NKA07355.1 hypothetical protein [Ralstonia solanacearum]OIN73231.1 hypothetical protein BL247_08645 [Ralstonia solanacearum]QWF61550.1 hypothetical protein KM864_02805 [Ralstonia solanacearum]
MNSAQPDYLVSDGRLQLNEAGQAFNELRARIEHEAAQLDRSWAGAFLASILIAEPWLAAFDLNITVSHEYDDQGGTFLSYSSAVSEVRTVEGVTLPDTMVDDGAFDEDLAANYLTEQFDACERDIYVTFRDDDDSQELKIEVRREPIASLLVTGAVRGTDAFQALFPHQAASPPPNTV